MCGTEDVDVFGGKWTPREDRGTADAWEHFDSRVVSLMRHLSRRFSFEGIQPNVSGRANEEYKGP